MNMIRTSEFQLLHVYYYFAIKYINLNSPERIAQILTLYELLKIVGVREYLLSRVYDVIGNQIHFNKFSNLNSTNPFE